MKKLMVYSHNSAVRDTIEGFEKTGSPVITDDCGFSPFGADISTSRKTAFEKIGARVAGTMRPRPSGSDRENSIMTRYYDNEGSLNLYYLFINCNNLKLLEIYRKEVAGLRGQS